MASGLKLYSAKDYLGALAVFKEAYDRFPSSKILLNIGTTLKALGRDAEAANAYQGFLDAADANPAKRGAVEKELTELDGKLATVEIESVARRCRAPIGDEQPHPASELTKYRVEPGQGDRARAQDALPAVREDAGPRRGADDEPERRSRRRTRGLAGWTGGLDDADRQRRSCRGAGAGLAVRRDRGREHRHQVQGCCRRRRRDDAGRDRIAGGGRRDPRAVGGRLCRRALCAAERLLASDARGRRAAVHREWRAHRRARCGRDPVRHHAAPRARRRARCRARVQPAVEHRRHPVRSAIGALGRL